MRRDYYVVPPNGACIHTCMRVSIACACARGPEGLKFTNQMGLPIDLQVDLPIHQISYSTRLACHFKFYTSKFSIIYLTHCEILPTALGIKNEHIHWDLPLLRLSKVKFNMNHPFLRKITHDNPIFISGAPGGTRIMDLDQYLEKMNTNTNVIWILKSTAHSQIHQAFLVRDRKNASIKYPSQL